MANYLCGLAAFLDAIDAKVSAAEARKWAERLCAAAVEGAAGADPQVTPAGHRLVIHLGDPAGKDGWVELDGRRLQCTGFQVAGRVGELTRVDLQVLVTTLDLDVVVENLRTVHPGEAEPVVIDIPSTS